MKTKPQTQITALATLDAPMTFAARLEQIKVATLENHCAAVLANRIDFKERLRRAVKHELVEVLEAMTGG
jgi:hypothetical protein